MSSYGMPLQALAGGVRADRNWVDDGLDWLQNIGNPNGPSLGAKTVQFQRDIAAKDEGKDKKDAGQQAMRTIAKALGARKGFAELQPGDIGSAASTDTASTSSPTGLQPPTGGISPWAASQLAQQAARPYLDAMKSQMSYLNDWQGDTIKNIPERDRPLMSAQMQMDKGLTDQLYNGLMGQAAVQPYREQVQYYQQYQMALLNAYLQGQISQQQFAQQMMLLQQTGTQNLTLAQQKALYNPVSQYFLSGQGLDQPYVPGQ